MMLVPGLGVQHTDDSPLHQAKSHHHLVGDLASSWSQGAISLGLCVHCPHGNLTRVTRVRAQILGERKAKDASGLPPGEEPEHKRQRGNRDQCILPCDLTGSAMVNIDCYLDRL